MLIGSCVRAALDVRPRSLTLRRHLRVAAARIRRIDQRQHERGLTQLTHRVGDRVYQSGQAMHSLVAAVRVIGRSPDSDHRLAAMFKDCIDTIPRVDESRIALRATAGRRWDVGFVVVRDL